ncbi:MAG TPA: DNA repair protein RecN [Armatimonadota bacterium]|jgi:DNA repair protein RecN (Recombination protein N)
MLSEIHIRNFALIERLDLLLAPGLNIVTGETGAGKSIFIDAINAVLGERTGSDVIRSGAERASVEGAFSTNDAPSVTARLVEEGLDDEEDLLVLTRELVRGGQGAARVNGRRTTVGVLRSVGDGLVDVHGQHEHQSLLSVERHVDILDSWGGAEICALRERTAALHAQWRAALAEMTALQMDERERARRVDLYSFQADEIESASPQPGEDEALMADRIRIGGAEKLAAAAGEAHDLLNGEGGTAVEALGTAMSRLRDAVRLDAALQPMLDSVENAYYTAQEAARDLSAYVEGVEFSPERLQEVEDRLDILRRLKRKYGDSLEEVIAYRDRISAELEALQGADARIEELTAEIERIRGELDIVNGQLRAQRREAGESLRRAMELELGDLAMEKTRVEVSLTPIDPTAKGADHVEFLMSPNPGEPLKPLARIASGGELSRLMLALKSVVAKADPVPVLVFDEIDTGVSGRQAGVIAAKMRGLAASSQVLCVTHSPQIAAAADQHYVIRKTVEGGRTLTHVTPLDEAARVEEVARMLAGASPTESARAHARALIAEFHAAQP